MSRLLRFQDVRPACIAAVSDLVPITTPGRGLGSISFAQLSAEQFWRESVGAGAAEWWLGSQEFRRRMLARITGRVGENHESAIRREAAESQAEGIMAKELAGLEWTGAELARRRECDPAEVALAARLRRETTLTMKWIAARLHLGSVQSARARVHALPNPTAKGEDRYSNI